MGQREFFNELALRWDSICFHDPERINRILDLIGFRHGDRVLDVGSGTGILLPYIQTRIGTDGWIDAVDVAEEMLAVARAKWSWQNVAYLHGDVLLLPLAPGQYQQVVCYSVFPHFRDKQLALERLTALLQPGGRLTVCHSQSRAAINGLHRKASQDVANDNLPAVEVIIKLFADAGLEADIVRDEEEIFVVGGLRGK